VGVELGFYAAQFLGVEGIKLRHTGKLAAMAIASAVRFQITRRVLVFFIIGKTLRYFLCLLL